MPSRRGPHLIARCCSRDAHRIHVLVDGMVLKGACSPENGVIGRVRWWIGACEQVRKLSVNHMRGAGCGVRPERIGGLVRWPSLRRSQSCGGGAHWVRQSGAAEGGHTHLAASRMPRSFFSGRKTAPACMVISATGFSAFLWRLTFSWRSRIVGGVYEWRDGAYAEQRRAVSDDGG